MFKSLAAWMLFLAFPLGVATLGQSFGQTPAVQEGRQYLVLKSPQRVESGDRIEVLVFFSYACQRCVDLEPSLQQWLASVPADVAFRRVPMLSQPTWDVLARLFYALEASGAEPRLSPEVFTAINRDRIDLTDEQNFFAWAARNGLDRGKVDKTYHSIDTATKLARAHSLARRYDVEQEPLIVVDGKFAVDLRQAGTAEQVPIVLDALIAKARAERRAAK